MSDGMKFDSGKLPWHLLPMDAVEEIVKVLEYGEKKYAANNWQLVDNAEQRYYSALLRHLKLWACGEERDRESGLKHLAHVATNALFLVWFSSNKKEESKDASVLTSKGTGR